MVPLLAPLDEQEEGFRMEVPADAEPRACGEQVSEVSELGVGVGVGAGEGDGVGVGVGVAGPR